MGDLARPDPKNEGLGPKIWSDGQVWAENEWPKIFLDWYLARGPARPKRS